MAAPAPAPDLRIVQKLGASIPQDLMFRDESGASVALGECLGNRPVILTPVYYGCPVLCTEVLNGLIRSLKGVALEPGRDFALLTVSFDPRESPELAQQKKEACLERYGQPQARASWHFLTGEAASIGPLMEAVGFQYRFDEHTGLYAHPAAIIVLTPDGRVSRYLLGVDYPPRDLRLALVEAAGGRVGTPVDQLLLLCYRYDPAAGAYSLQILRILRVGAAATLIGLALLIYGMSRRRSRRAPSAYAPACSDP